MCKSKFFSRRNGNIKTFYLSFKFAYKHAITKLYSNYPFRLKLLLPDIWKEASYFKEKYVILKYFRQLNFHKSAKISEKFHSSLNFIFLSKVLFHFQSCTHSSKEKDLFSRVVGRIPCCHISFSFFACEYRLSELKMGEFRWLTSASIIENNHRKSSGRKPMICRDLLMTYRMGNLSHSCPSFLLWQVTLFLLRRTILRDSHERIVRSLAKFSNRYNFFFFFK